MLLNGYVYSFQMQQSFMIKHHIFICGDEFSEVVMSFPKLTAQLHIQEL